MKKTKQLILAVLLSVFLSALLSGCGAGSSEPMDLEANTDPGAETDTTVTENGFSSDTFAGDSKFVPMKEPYYTLTTELGPLEPAFIPYNTECYFNEKRVVTPENYPGDSGTVTNFDWKETNNGGHCLMILIDTQKDHGAGNYSLIVPGYEIPKISKNGEYIHIIWESSSSPDERIYIRFMEGTNYLIQTENPLKGIVQGPDSDIVEMAVSIYDDGTDSGCYYVPVYAILDEIGGGVMFDPLGDGAAFIFTGDVLNGYTGFWEVSDETEYRIDVVRNGQTVSVANYWWALALTPEGGFTEYSQFYQDEGDWVKSEKNGEYAFFGRVLAMKYLDETEWRGRDLDNMNDIRTGGYGDLYGDGDGVGLYPRYVDYWDPAEVLSIRGYNVLYSHEMSGRTWEL